MGILNLDIDNTTYYVELDSNIGGFDNNQNITYSWELIDDGTIGSLTPDTSTLNNPTFIVRGIDIFDVDTHIFTVRLTVTQDDGCDNTQNLTINVTDEVNEIKNIITVTGTTDGGTTSCDEGSLLINGGCITIEDFIDSLILIKIYPTINVPDTNTLGKNGGLVKHETSSTIKAFFSPTNNEVVRWLPYYLDSNGYAKTLSASQASLIRKKIHIDKYVPKWYKAGGQTTTTRVGGFTIGEVAFPSGCVDVAGGCSPSCSDWGCFGENGQASYLSGGVWQGSPRVNNTYTNIDTGVNGTSKATNNFTNYSVLFMKKKYASTTSSSPCDGTGCDGYGVDDIVQLGYIGSISVTLRKYWGGTDSSPENEFIYIDENNSPQKKLFSSVSTQGSSLQKDIIGVPWDNGTPTINDVTDITSNYSFLEVYAIDDGTDEALTLAGYGGNSGRGNFNPTKNNLDLNGNPPTGNYLLLQTTSSGGGIGADGGDTGVGGTGGAIEQLGGGIGGGGAGGCKCTASSTGCSNFSTLPTSVQTFIATQAGCSSTIEFIQKCKDDGVC